MTLSRKGFEKKTRKTKIMYKNIYKYINSIDKDIQCMENLHFLTYIIL